VTRIDRDDPKWTAYVLGEMDDAARAAVEEELNTSEDARGLVEELRVAAAMIKTELSTKATPVQRLTNQQRQAIQIAAGSIRSRNSFKAWLQPRRIGWITALAAAGAAAAVLVVSVRPHPREQAMQNAEIVLPPPPAGRATEPTAAAAGDAETLDSTSRSSTAAIRQNNQSSALSARGKLFGKAQDATAAKIPAAAVVATNTDQTRTDEKVQLDQNVQKEKDITLQAASLAEAGEVKPSAPATTAATRRAGVLGGVSSTATPASDAVAKLEENAKASAAPSSPPALKAQPLSLVAKNAAGTSSYSNVRAYLTQNQLPPATSVHIDEMVNHFSYDNPELTGNDPISTSVEAASAPWDVQHRLVRIGIRAREAANVTVQVEFNPTEVAGYHVIGRNPAEGALNLSAGQSLTILYELLPSAKKSGAEILNLRVRYLEDSRKQPETLNVPFIDRGETFEASSIDFRFAAAVASFGMTLTNLPSNGTTSLDSVRVIAENSLGMDRDGSRHEFLDLVRRASQLRP
jgi:hypothetical protein